MNGYKYEKYDYSFLYDFLTEEQRKSLQLVLDRFIGYPNVESTRNAVEIVVNRWILENNINIKGKIKIDYE